jgi:hypothetical protein
VERIRRSIELDEEPLRTFEEYYPMRGAITWFVNETLKHFVAIHTEDPSASIYESVEYASGLAIPDEEE